MVNYKKVLNEVNSVNSSVTLVAVSKTKPIEDIITAYNDGARLFGENRVQEIEEKFSIDRPEGMKVYLIGHLQSNKVKKAVALVDRIESVDSLKLVSLLDKECERQNKYLEILLEINSSGEEQKSGFTSVEELMKAAEFTNDSKYLTLKGLMTVGPLGSDYEKNKKAFCYAKSIFDSIKDKYRLSVLSMGMSGDWKEAIAFGSTEVRIGSAIFGERM